MLFKGLFIVVLAILSCATPSTPQTQLASRISHASTHNPCTPNATVSEACLDDDGLVWSACAWNSCGMSQTCRDDQQKSQLAGNCGTSDWPPCNSR